ncbi:MAG: T9SS type A sorting domain-containing protein [Candidatus Cloacimonetes bacterium]|nr:T9SS type A sorting domain-containing protein [Candidatus Cloacimonadota bacterium]
MKRSIVILVVFFSVLLSNAAGIEYCRSFDYPQVSNKAQGMVIEYEDCLLSGAEGEPYLPWQGISLLLPQNECIETISLKSVEYYDKEEQGCIAPAGRQFFISQPGPADYQPVPDPEIYEKDAVFPASCLSDFSTGFLCGHSIGSFRFCPVEYNPVQGSLRFIKSIELEIKTQAVDNAEELSANLRSTKKVQERIEMIVENPEVFNRYSETSFRPDDYDILLITIGYLTDEFAEYVEFKESTGYKVAVVTTGYIQWNYPGDDDADMVRNCIIDYYQNHGIEYVILGGDAGNPNEEAIVPARYLFAENLFIPSDMYYSNLDGAWNIDNDYYYGEAGEVDPYSEVSIGRMCVDLSMEAVNSINKHILYQNSPVIEDIDKVVMAGEYYGGSVWGGDYLDQIVSGGYFNGYATTGISGNMNINYHYDRDMFWSKYDLFEEFSENGLNLIIHAGHSNTDYNMKMYNYDLTEENFTNDGTTRGLGIGYSQGCYNGAFDNCTPEEIIDDCFAEKITGDITGGFVACIANSRYGTYDGHGTNSSTQFLSRKFVEGIFGEEIYNIGDANTYSHEAAAGLIDGDELMKMVCYGTNLFGDPSLDIWTAEPEDIIATLPLFVPLGASQISIQTSIAGARVAILQDGLLLGRGLTRASGILNLELDLPVDSTAYLAVSIIRHNYNRYEAEIEVVANQPYVIYQSHSLDELSGNGDGLADYGETIILDMELSNIGMEDADNTTINLTTEDEFISIIDGEESIGHFPAETIIEILDAVSFSIQDNVPDQHTAVFMVTVTGDTQEWLSFFEIVVNAPALQYGGISIDDSIEGNENGILEPGETAAISLEILNTGHSNSPFASLELSSDNPEIIVIEDSVELGIIAADSCGTGIFTVSAGEDIEIGTSAGLTLFCQADNYTFEEEIRESVGLIIEDFESGNFSTYEWESGGDAAWTIETSTVFEGTYSIRSGAIGNLENSILTLYAAVRYNSEISFMYQVSSDANNDWLFFCIDGVEQFSISGEVEWSEARVPITRGVHILEWRYSKNGNVASGEDCAWLDYIIFPQFRTPEAPALSLEADEIQMTVEEHDTVTSLFNISNAGDETLLWQVNKYYPDSRGSGGPDEYGYAWMDNNEYSEIEFNWIDISSTGVAVDFIDENTSTELIPIGFPFYFYGEEYEEFRINPNGWIGFGEDNTESVNTSLPNSDAPCPAILPFWDDLHPFIENEGGGVVYYQVYDGHLVVMFDDVFHFSGNNEGTYSFEVIIWVDGTIKMQYNTLVGDLDSCTVGIQNSNFSIGLPVVFNDTYLEEGLAIEIKKIDDWLEISPLSGEISYGGSRNLELIFDTGNLAIGEYHCNMIICTNAPGQEEVIVPITLTIVESDTFDNNLIYPTSCLHCNYPNPFNPCTTISYQLAEDTDVELMIYNIKGQHIITLVNGLQESGEHSVEWQGLDKKGNQISSGIYLYRLSAGSTSLARKMILLK